MNTEMTQVSEEITYLRETLNNTENLIADVDLERLQRALILSQTRLLSLDIERPTTVKDCGISIAYH